MKYGNPYFDFKELIIEECGVLTDTLLTYQLYTVPPCATSMEWSKIGFV